MGEDREIKTISWNPSAHVSQSGDQKGGMEMEKKGKEDRVCRWDPTEVEVQTW